LNRQGAKAARKDKTKMKPQMNAENIKNCACELLRPATPAGGAPS